VTHSDENLGSKLPKTWEREEVVSGRETPTQKRAKGNIIKRDMLPLDSESTTPTGIGFSGKGKKERNKAAKEGGEGRHDLQKNIDQRAGATKDPSDTCPKSNSGSTLL